MDEEEKNNVYLQSHMFVYQDLWNLFFRTQDIHVKLKTKKNNKCNMIQCLWVLGVRVYEEEKETPKFFMSLLLKRKNK